MCHGCEEGYRPIDPDSWSTPEPCPLCKHSHDLEDKKLLERYKVGLVGCIGISFIELQPPTQRNLYQKCIIVILFQEMYLKLTVKSDVEFDVMCEEVVDKMGDVYSNRSISTFNAILNLY